jgi:hypothetical protein
MSEASHAAPPVIEHKVEASAQRGSLACAAARVKRSGGPSGLWFQQAPSIDV